jgi:pyruvate kinase
MGPQAGLIAKIERAEAIPRLEEILAASDGIMVARGDLAVEVGNAGAGAAEKDDPHGARADKVVITATQMMESMITNPVPTRAEVSDVANAVLDGTDAVMLSAETAAGKYPLETVQQMAAICLAAEQPTPPSWTPTSAASTSGASTSPSPWARCSPPTTWAPRPSWR